MSEKDTSAPNLFAYLPDVVFDWQRDDPAAVTREVEGTAVFVDVAGFTAMSERLARKGNIGAEEVTEVLNSVFSNLLSASRQAGGGLVKFGGDALVIFFSGDRHAHRACWAAAAMRQHLREAGPVRTSAGAIRIRVSTGVHSGHFLFVLAGRSHRELMLVGPSVSRTVELESCAQANQILISHETAAQLPAGTPVREHGAGFLLKGRIAEPMAVLAPPVAPVGLNPEEFLPEAVRAPVRHKTQTAEHRLVTVAFVSFSGTDAVHAELGPAELQRRLDSLVACAQEAAAEYNIAFLASDLAANGGKIILCAGAPLSTGSDEAALLQAVRQVADGDYGLTIRIGVNRGRVFAGVVGPTFRRTYTIMGDAVNLAARVMAHCQGGQVLATMDVVDSADIAFETEAVEPFRVKGKREPVRAVSVGAAKGTRSRYGAVDTAIIGRAAEVQYLFDAAEAVVAGESRVIEIVGEAGLGKSRLLEELRGGCGLPALNLTCEQYESSTGYFPFRAGVRELLAITEEDRERGGRQLLRALRQKAPHVLPWAPLLALVADVMVPTTPQAEALEPRFRRARLHQVMRDVLSRTLGMPAAILAEDVHWADQASLELLRDLAAGTENNNWLIIATSRPLEEPSLASDDQPASLLRLSPVAESSAIQLASMLAGEEPLPLHEARAIALRAGGNPLFLRELVAASVSGSESLPDSIEAMITARIDRLPYGARMLLRYAAVAGASVELDLLREIAAPAAEVPSWAQLRRVVRGIAEVDRDSLRFRHALFRDVAYENLPYRERRRLHREYARAIEERSRDDQAELLSLHYFTAGESRKAWRYSLLSGERAQQKSANVEAADFYERALSAGELSGKPRRELASVCELMGDACELAGVYERAGRAYRLAKRYARGRKSHSARLFLKQGVVQERLGRYSQALRLYSLGLKTTRRRADMVRLRLAYAGVRFRQGRYLEQERLAREVIAGAGALGDNNSLGHAYYLLALALMSLQRPGHKRFARKALAIFRKQGDLVRQANVLNNMGIAAYYVGDWNGALDHYQRSREARELAGDVVGVATQDNNIGEILSDQGRLEEAGARFEQASLTWRGARYRVGVALVASNLGRLAARRGDLSRALELLRDARSSFEEMGATAFVLETQLRVAEAHVFAGRPDDALATIATFVDDLKPGTEVLQAAVHRTLGYARMQKGASQGALEAIEKSLRLARSASAEYEAALTLEAQAHALRLARTGYDTQPLIEARKLFDSLGVVTTVRVPLPTGAEDQARFGRT